MSASYENWRRWATVADYQPLTSERLAEIHAATCRYGSGNGWTGTSGELCTMIRELLVEVEQLRKES